MLNTIKFSVSNLSIHVVTQSSDIIHLPSWQDFHMPTHLIILQFSTLIQSNDIIHFPFATFPAYLLI